MPPYLTNEARDLIKKLLKKKPSQRYGSGPDDALPLKVRLKILSFFFQIINDFYSYKKKTHPFFRTYLWENVYNRSYEPPYKPTLVSILLFFILLLLFKNLNGLFIKEKRRRCKSI